MHDGWKVLAPVDPGVEAEAHVQHALNAAEAVKGDLTMLYVLDGRTRHAEALGVAGKRHGSSSKLSRA